ncbi:winged helix-turn-helix transcriptional regulator [Aminipila butyrica]|uniref:Winged helix-turn-helix transcriptional regulator n=1 Tax=Aminipila butyrica TaxID=433296 RepID=A0A858BTZ7_9FIRM|nr:MarR family transcriptional regulator [Aminipila butyrica]QIB68548.1 winged helix-turn-helix transcriptional regulator [Aminipila butyrica]
MKTRSIGMELRTLNNIIMRVMNNHTHKKYIDSITGTNGWIIGYIAHHGHQDVFQKDLEQHFCITRSTASSVINLMVQRGLIERHSVPYDARLKKLVLTPKALQFTRFMEEDGKKMEEILTKEFSLEELETLRSYILRMKTNLKEYDSQP